MASKFVFSRVEDVNGLVVMPATILMSQNDPYGWCGAERDTLLIKRLLPFRTLT